MFDAILCSLVVILVTQFLNDIGYVGSVGFIATISNDQELLINDFAVIYPKLSDVENYNFDWGALYQVTNYLISTFFDFK